ncbi:BGTF surface domain-containing protein [Halosegnis sp.]|uniref:DUF7282 domain-containing protein n=1 Tax=Halosegnis sp. TaxID=2864959 RepID=UPI0035D45E62
MATPWGRLRALALAGLLLASALGPLGLAGTAAAANAQITDAVEYDGTIEVVFDKIVKDASGNTLSNTELASSSGDESVTVLIDGAELAATDFSISNVRVDDSGATRVDVVLSDDVGQSRNVTVKFEGLNGGSATSSVTTTAQEVSEEGAVTDSNYPEGQETVIVYDETRVAIAGIDENTNFDAFSRTGFSTGTNSRVEVIDLAALDVSLGTQPVEFKVSGSQNTKRQTDVRLFNLSLNATDVVSDEDLTATVADIDSPTDRTNTTLVNADGEKIRQLIDERYAPPGTGASLSELNFGQQPPDGSPYTVIATDNVTGISARVTVNVTAAAAPDANFNQRVYTEQRGDVVEVKLVTNSPFVTVNIGNEQLTGYEQSITVEDVNGDGKVTLVVNTYAVGSGSGYSVANDDKLVRQRAARGPFVDSGAVVPSAATLDAALYRLNASANAVSATGTSGIPNATATLALESRSVTDLTTLRLPGGRAGEIENASDLQRLFEQEVATPGTVLAGGDVAVARVKVSGVEGIIERERDPGESTTKAFYDADAFEFTLTRERRPNVQPETLVDTTPSSSVDSGVRVVAQPDADAYWVLVNTTAFGGLETGDQLTGNFTFFSDEVDDLGKQEAVSVTGQWRFQRPQVSVTPTGDFDGDGDRDGVAVVAAPGQRVEGRTNFAPGTRLRIVALDNNKEVPFVLESTTTVGPDGQFATAFDLTGLRANTSFTVQVRRGGEVVERADGRILNPPTPGLTVAETVSTNGTVTVESVTLSAGGFLAVYRGGPTGAPVAHSEYLGFGRHTNVRIPVSVNGSLSPGETLTVVAHRDTDGDGRFDYQPGSQVDGPYAGQDGIVADAIQAPGTPTPTPTPTPTATPTPSVTPNVSVTPTPTSNATVTPTVTPNATPTPTESSGQSGLGIAAAALAILLAARLRRT